MTIDKSLEGRVALITGGARGQGRSHAQVLAEQGADIVICDVPDKIVSAPYPLGTEGELKETQALIEKTGRRCLALTADVRRSEDMAEVARRTVDQFGRIDILVANAGIVSYAPTWELTDETWNDMIAVNLTGVFNSMRAVVPTMIEQGHGRIIATGSMAGRTGVPNLAHYVAAKWGVIGLVKTLSLEVAPHGITVNAVLPSNVDTPMIQNAATYNLLAPDVADAGRDIAAERFAAGNPMGVPWVEVDEISAAVAFLVSDGARHISGSTIDISAATSGTLTC